MTIVEILHLFNDTIPGNLCKLANYLTSLDDQTALDIVSKYNADIKLSQKQLSDEIQKQRIKKANEL